MTADDSGQHPVRLEDALPEGRRFDRAVEAALYVCCLEAVQNATKHAGDQATITVRLGLQGDEIRASVRDDAVGFDPEAVLGQAWDS